MIVLDSSTLILLARAELLEKFIESCGQKVAIPKQVEKESCAAKKSLDALLIQKAISEGSLSVMTVRNRKVYEKVRDDFALGKGEAEAIALAFAKKAKLVAIDDKSGINACKLLEIPFTTAVSVLVRMCEKGVVSKEEATAKLEALARFGRYDRGILQDARSKLEGR